MIKHKELSDPSSCLNKADALEPVFVLRAKDPLAPQTIRHWVTMSVGRHEPEKLQEALKWAESAEQWRAKNVVEQAPVERGNGRGVGVAMDQGYTRDR